MDQSYFLICATCVLCLHLVGSLSNALKCLQYASLPNCPWEAEISGTIAILTMATIHIALAPNLPFLM
jgi:hypothetical protein